VFGAAETGGRVSDLRGRVSEPSESETPDAVAQTSDGVSWTPDTRDADLKALTFSRKAPGRIRDDRRFPPEVIAAAELLWDELLPVVYDAVRDLPRRERMRKSTVVGVVQKVRTRFPQFVEFLVTAAVQRPIATSSRSWRNTASLGLASGGVTLVEEAAGYGSLFAASTQVILSAIVWEVMEIYGLASVRVNQYRRAQRSPEPETVLRDLEKALGRRAPITRTRDEAVRLLVEYLGKRIPARAVEALAAGVGVGWAALSTARASSVLQRLSIAPQTGEELRLAKARYDEGKPPWPTELEARAFFDDQPIRPLRSGADTSRVPMNDPDA